MAYQNKFTGSLTGLVASHVGVVIDFLVEDVFALVCHIDDRLEEFHVGKLSTLILRPLCTAQNLHTQALSAFQVDDLANNLVHRIDLEVGVSICVSKMHLPKMWRIYRFSMIVTASLPHVNVA